MANRRKPMSAVKRGIIGASIGFAATFVLFVITIVSGEYRYVPPISLFMQLFAGPFYGFGLAFANWKIVLEETKKGAIHGAAGLGIGLILSHWLLDKRWGMWGWLFFLFRVSWHLGFCWIPGIAYGISAVREELKHNQQTNTTAVPKRNGTATQAPPLRQVTPAAAPTVAPVAAPAFTNKIPKLQCTAGIFMGAEFPLQGNEEITIGSNPSLSQIILPAECAENAHCKIRFNKDSSCWQVIDLSGGKTYKDGIWQLPYQKAQFLPSGTTLCIGQGKNCQRFKLG